MPAVTDESQKKNHAERNESDAKRMHDVWGQFYKVRDRAKLIRVIKIRAVIASATGGLALMGHEGTFGGDENVLYLNCGVTYMGALIFQSS